MKSSFAIAAALAPLALAQGTLDVQQINNAPAPTATAPPEVNNVDMAAVEASLSSAVSAATATATAAPAKFRMARAADPTFWWPPKDKDCSPWSWWKPCKIRCLRSLLLLVLTVTLQASQTILATQIKTHR